MSWILRIVLGLSVVTVAIPVIINVLSGEVATEGADASPAILDPVFPREPTVDGHLPSIPSLVPDRRPLSEVDDGDEFAVSNRDPSATGPAESDDPTTSITASGAPPTTGTSTKQSASTTTTGPTTNSKPRSEAPGQTSGTITGDACPCTVTGTVELVGEINLRGDLIVDGGTLVARPGVNLNGNGFQIMFILGGKADFQGTPVFTWSDNGSKANLKRDINLRNLRRIMFTGGAGRSVLRYFTLTNSGGPNLDDYPLHWHLNGDSTRGTIVEGVVVVNGANHAFVPHGSHGITFKDVIAKNTQGEAIWWNPPGSNDCSQRRRFCTADNSNDILLDRVLIDGVSNAPGDNRGFELAGILLSAGSGNTIRNSAVINVYPSNGKNCAAFQWPSTANLNVGGNVWTFENNYGESRCHGIFVWQNDPGDHVIDGFTGGGIVHGAYNNRYQYRNIDVPYVIARAGGWSISKSRIGELLLLPPGKTSPNDPTLRVTDSEVGRLVIDNRSKERRENPPVYEFVNIGLECSDVEWVSVEPGTSLTLDNVTCEY